MHHRAQLIDRQSSLQTSQKEHSDRIPFTLTYQTKLYQTMDSPMHLIAFTSLLVPMGLNMSQVHGSTW